MSRVRLVVVTLLVTAAMLAETTAPALAQAGGQWFYHPNSGNHWYCAYFPGSSPTEYWCYTEYGTWVGAHSPEMMQQVDGWQPV
jgi:hypothetical protein